MPQINKGDALPGLPVRFAALVLLVPLGTVAGIFLAGFLHLPEGLGFAIGFLVPAAIIAAVAIREKNRRRKALGLIPQRAGYSAQVELLAVKLRERADELEQAMCFDRNVDIPFELQSFSKEILSTAADLDHRNLLTNLQLSIPQESQLGFGGVDDASKAAIESQMKKLGDAASELEAYAADVRERGGVYRAPEGQLAGCTALLFLMLLGGAFLISNSHLWWGVGLVSASLLFGWIVIASQREPA